MHIEPTFIVVIFIRAVKILMHAVYKQKLNSTSESDERECHLVHLLFIKVIKEMSKYL